MPLKILVPAKKNRNNISMTSYWPDYLPRSQIVFLTTFYIQSNIPSSVGRPYMTSLPETLDAAVDAGLGRCDADQHQKRYHNERYWLHVWICESLFKQNDTICSGTRVSYWAAQLFNTTEQHCRSRKAIYIKQKKWTFDLSRLCVKYPSTQNLRKRQQSYQQHSGVNILTNSFHCKGGKIVNKSPKKPQMIYR